MASKNHPADRFSRRQALRNAIDKLERRFPYVRDPEVRPAAGSDEASVIEEYNSLQDSLYRENLSENVKRYVEAREGDDARADAALARFGLLPPPSVEGITRPTVSGVSPTPKQLRGKACEDIIQELKFLRGTIVEARTNFTFEVLQRMWPSLEILKILSRCPFEDEDRELICHPHQWGRLITYATGLMKRYFTVSSDETIKGYRKAYKSRFQLTPIPSEPTRKETQPPRKRKRARK